MNDQPAMTALSAALDALVARYQVLAGISQEEREAVVQGDPSRVTEIADRKRSVTYEAMSLERQLRANPLVRHHGTLARVLERLEGSEEATLRRQRDELVLLTRSVERTNRITSRLLQRAVDYADTTVRLLKGAEEDGPSLFARPRASGSALLDRRV